MPSAMAAPAVSVAMPVRNGARYIDAAIDSIRTQGFADWEMVIVDDHSTDGTAAIIARHVAEDDRIRVVSATGDGIVDALNQAIASGAGALIARMDADDIAEPYRLERQVGAMARNPALVALGSAAMEIDADGAPVRQIAVACDDAAIRAALRTGNPLLHPTVMMRRAGVEQAGGYRRAFALAEDYDLWTRLAVLGDIANSPDPLLRLRRHGAQVSRARRLDQRAVSALVRQTAYGAPVDGFDARLYDAPMVAVAAWLALAARKPVDQAAMRDAAVMLRATARTSALSPTDRGAVRAALRPHLSWAQNLALDARLAAGR